MFDGVASLLPASTLNRRAAECNVFPVGWLVAVSSDDALGSLTTQASWMASKAQHQNLRFAFVCRCSAHEARHIIEGMEDALESDRCARMLRAMADPERLKIIQCLRTGPKNVSEIAETLGAEVVNVSHHLGVLRQASIVLDQRQGRFVVYRLHPEVFQPTAHAADSEHLDLGCCRLEIPKDPEE